MLDAKWTILSTTFFVIFVGFFSSSTAIGENDVLDLTYRITIDDPSNHILEIKLEVNNVTDTQLKLTRQAPYETNPSILSMTIKDSNGSGLPYTIDNDVEGYETYAIKSISTTSITVEYSIDLEYFEQDPIGGYSNWNLDASYGAVESQFIFLQPVMDSAINNCKAIALLPPDWKMISRLNQVDSYHYANIDDKVFHTFSDSEEIYEFVIWGPVVFGNFRKYFRNIGGLQVEVAVYGNSKHQAEFTELVFAVCEYLTETIGPLNDPPISYEPIKYLYVFLNSEGDHRVHSGDHIYGQIVTILSSDIFNKSSFRSHSHLIAHTWFCHSALSTNTIYPNVTDEGIVQFYALKSLDITGLWNSSEVNNHLKAWYSDYENYILGTQYDVPLSEEAIWGKFPDDHLQSIYRYGIMGIIAYEKFPLVYYLLDWKIADFSNREMSLDDVWRYCHDHYPGNPYNQGQCCEYIEYDSGYIGAEICPFTLLVICNLITGYDFTPFFEKYIYGNAPLPYYVEDGYLKINSLEIPEPILLSSLGRVKLFKFIANDSLLDSDRDLLPDNLEGFIATDVHNSDTDFDGLSDREEFGVIIDGKPGEYAISSALVSDSEGDSESEASGTDIRELYAKIFLNENGKQDLYLTLSTWDNHYNPDIWYEIIFVTSDSETYGYRFDSGRSYLFNEDANIVDGSEGKVEGWFEDYLEVKIPLDFLHSPDWVTLEANTRDFYNPQTPDYVDHTDPGTITIESRIFITDPLNADTDGDGYSDGDEVSAGTDPNDPDPDSDPLRMAMPWIPLLLLGD